MKGLAVLLFAFVTAVAARNECPKAQESNWHIEYLYEHEDCDKFYQCAYGQPVEQICPAGLFYNVELSQCDWRQNVDCGDRNVHGGPDMPESGEQNPDSGENRPASGEQRPESEENRPGSGEQRPESGENKPGSGEQKPESGENKPGSGEQRPESGENKPGSGEQKPESGENRPGSGEQRPESGENRPEPSQPSSEESESSFSESNEHERPEVVESNEDRSSESGNQERPDGDNSHESPVDQIEFLDNGCPVNPHIHWLIPHRRNCNLFYYCVHGTRILRGCPALLHFNPVLQVCDWPDRAGCVSNDRPSGGGSPPRA